MRTISINRYPGLIDMHWPIRSGIKSYDLKFATNFDGVFALIANVPATGYKSRTAASNRFDSGQFRGQTRVQINPADFEISDSIPIWIRMDQIGWNGVVGLDEGMLLVLPFNPQPKRAIILHGNVPAAADVAHSLELNLPQQCFNQNIQNDGSVDMMVAFEPNGYEFRVPPLSTSFTNLSSVHTAFSQIFLRGVASGTKISAEFTLRNEAIC
jgi:hypothetical protein